MLLIEHVLFAGSILVLISILSSKASGRMGIPALLLFLGIGMLAGSEGVGRIEFGNPYLAQSLGVTALAFILFAGGLGTKTLEIRRIVRTGVSLSTIGVLVTALLVGLFAETVFGFSRLEGLLLGSIVSSTDAAAVFSILKSKRTNLKGDLRPLLEFESGSNDPMAVFLTVGVLGLMTRPETSPLDLVPMFLRQMILGGAIGYGFGRLFVLAINRIRLEYEGLYPVFTLAGVLFIYSSSATLGGNGFLAVYIAGLVLGNRDFLHRNSLVRFHDGLAWLMQIGMFLSLGLLVVPSRLVSVAGPGLLLAVFLVLVARPIAVFASLGLSKLGWKEKTLVSWVGLRGAAPIVLATFPLLAGASRADEIFNLIFFVVLVSVLTQGTMLPVVARVLRLASPAERARATRLELTTGDGVRAKLSEVVVPPHSPIVGKAIVELGLPKEALIVLIERRRDLVVPKGETAILAGDTLMVVADAERFALVRRIVLQEAAS